MPYETINFERDGHVLVMGLNRPQKRNAFDMTMLRQLAAACGELDGDDELRAGVPVVQRGGVRRALSRRLSPPPPPRRPRTRSRRPPAAGGAGAP